MTPAEENWSVWSAQFVRAAAGTPYIDLARDLALCGPHSGFICHVEGCTPKELEPIREAIEGLIDCLHMSGQMASLKSLRQSLTWMEQGKNVSVRFPAE